MATRTSPRLAAQKLVGSSPTLGKENLVESSKPTAGGSRSQKVTCECHFFSVVLENLAGLRVDIAVSDSEMSKPRIHISFLRPNLILY